MICHRCGVRLAHDETFLALHERQRWALVEGHGGTCSVRALPRRPEKPRHDLAYTGGWERVGLILRPAGRVA